MMREGSDNVETTLLLGYGWCIYMLLSFVIVFGESLQRNRELLLFVGNFEISGIFFGFECKDVCK